MSEEKLNKSEFLEIMKDRTKRYALNSIFIFQKLPKTDEAKIIGNQFLRAATSVAANYRALCRARSKAEFYSKLNIVVEEADEVQLWLELLIESKTSAAPATVKMHKEISEILAILTTARKHTTR